MNQSTTNSRREFLRKSALAAAATVAWIPLTHQQVDAFSGQEDAAGPPPEGPFKLDPMPYGFAALEPYLDARTMEIHYTKHHQGYVDKLNAAIEKSPELKGRSLQELFASLSSLPEGARSPVRNMGGGHWNHTFFWKILTPQKEMTQPEGKLKEAMTAQWNTFDAFKEQFKQQGLSVFGSGWVWLIAAGSGKLSITTTPNQDNPLMEGSKEKGKPIMGVDVWEHAYYLKHQHKRADYLDAVWNVLNWKHAMEIYG